MGAKLPHKKKDFKPCSGFEVSFYSQAYGVSMGMAIHFFYFYFLFVFSSFIMFWSGALGVVVICTLPFSFLATFPSSFLALIPIRFTPLRFFAIV